MSWWHYYDYLRNRKTRDIYWSRDPIFMIFTNLKLSYNFNSIDMSDGMTWYHNYGCVNLNALEALENRKSRDSLIMRGQNLFLRAWLEFKQKMLQNDVYDAYHMSHMTWWERFFEKWVIAHNSRIKSKFKNRNPWVKNYNYAELIFPE